MALQLTLRLQKLFLPVKEQSFLNLSRNKTYSEVKRSNADVSCSCSSQLSKFVWVPLQGVKFRSSGVRASRTAENHRSDDGKKKRWEDSSDSDEDDYSTIKGLGNDPYNMTAEERREWRRKIREVMNKRPSIEDLDDDGKSSIKKGPANDPDLMDADERRDWRRTIREVMNKYPDAGEELDDEEKKVKMQKLTADYPLVVEEDDPDWPEDADGWGFSLGQFFNKITIQNVKKDDDEDYDSENEIVWKDDNYIRPVKDITSAEWEETVFKDISPLIVLVHNRYKRPKENEKIRDEIVKAVNIIWNCRLPSPRCVAVDAVVETDLASALNVSVFPEAIFTKSGKILYREKAIRSADEFSKIMAYFYYGSGKPPCLNGIETSSEPIPSLPVSNKDAQIITVNPLKGKVEENQIH